MKYYNMQIMYTEGYSIIRQFQHSEQNKLKLNEFAKDVKRSVDIAYMAVSLIDTEDNSLFHHVFIEGKGFERFLDNI